MKKSIARKFTGKDKIVRVKMQVIRNDDKPVKIKAKEKDV